MTISFFVPMWIIYAFEALAILWFIASAVKAVCRVILWKLRRDERRLWEKYR